MEEEYLDEFEEDRLTKRIVDLISKNYSIEQIQELLPKLESYMIISKLLRHSETDEQIINKIKEYYDNFRIDSDKCLIIADSHLGRIEDDRNEYDEENIELLNGNDYAIYEAYHYASKKNIKNIIHLGDLIEGNSDKTQRKMLPVEYQISHLIEVFPEKEDIQTYLLYGNHDLNAIECDGVEPDFYKKCKNTKLIGAEIGYIHIWDSFVKLSHISKDTRYRIEKVKNINLPYDFELSGHTHVYKYIEETRTIKVPSLTKDSKTRNVGFIELENAGEELIYRYIGDECKLMDEKVLKKTLT